VLLAKVGGLFHSGCPLFSPSAGPLLPSLSQSAWAYIPLVTTITFSSTRSRSFGEALPHALRGDAHTGILLFWKMPTGAISQFFGILAIAEVFEPMALLSRW